MHRWACGLIPVLFSIVRIKRFIEIFRYTTSESASGDWPVAELLSIATDPAWRGKGVTEAMYSELVDGFRKMDVTQFKIVVGEGLTPAHKFYKRMGAQVIGQVEVHGGKRSLVYVQEVKQ